MAQPAVDEFFRIGDRVLLADTDGASFDFKGAGLIAGSSKGTVTTLPEFPGIHESVLVAFDGVAESLAVAKRRLLLLNPLERLAREIS
jgi:hypothetical protein